MQIVLGQQFIQIIITLLPRKLFIQILKDFIQQHFYRNLLNDLCKFFLPKFASSNLIAFLTQLQKGFIWFKLLIQQSSIVIKMYNTRTKVHNDQRTMQEIKRRNEILVERLCKVKPVISSQDRPEKFTHIKPNNGKKRWINYRHAEAVRKQNEGMMNRIINIKMGQASFNHVNPLYIVKEANSSSRINSQDKRSEQQASMAVTNNENNQNIINHDSINLQKNNNNNSKGLKRLTSTGKISVSSPKKFGSERSISNGRLQNHPQSVHRMNHGQHRTRSEIIRENKMREIHQANRKLMERLISQKSLIQPVEKHIEDDIKRQKILKMRMQLKNTPIGSIDHRRRHNDSTKQASPLDNIFKTDLTSLQTLHTELVSQGGAWTQRTSLQREQSFGKPDMVFLNPAEKYGKPDIAPKCALQQSRSQMNLNQRKIKNEALFSHVNDSSKSNLTNDPYQLQNSVSGAALMNQSVSQVDVVSSYSKSPSPIAPQRSKTVMDPHQSRISEEGRTIFYMHYGANPKSGSLTSYKFSYDDTAYYFKIKRAEEDASHTLVLPVCRQTIELIEQYHGDMHSLAARLRLDKKTGNLYIQDFKPPVVDVEEGTERILPMLTKLLTQEAATCPQPRRNNERGNSSISQQIIKTHQEQVGKDNHLMSRQEAMVDIRCTSALDKQPQTTKNGKILFKQSTSSNVPSVFKSLASAKKKRGKEQSLSQQHSERKPPTGSKSRLSAKDFEHERQAYFQSKKMRGAPQITPLAPLQTTNKMLLNVRLKEKRIKQSRQRYKEKSEEILLDPQYSTNPIILNEDLNNPHLHGSGSVSHMNSLAQSNLVSPNRRIRSHNRRMNNLSFQENLPKNSALIPLSNNNNSNSNNGGDLPQPMRLNTNHEYYAASTSVGILTERHANGSKHLQEVTPRLVQDNNSNSNSNLQIDSQEVPVTSGIQSTMQEKVVQPDSAAVSAVTHNFNEYEFNQEIDPNMQAAVGEETAAADKAENEGDQQKVKPQIVIE